MRSWGSEILIEVLSYANIRLDSSIFFNVYRPRRHSLHKYTKMFWGPLAELCRRSVVHPVFARTRLGEIQSVDQHRQLFRTHDDAARSVGGRPAEAPALQPLGADPQTAAVPHQRFHPRPRTIGEQKQMAAL